MKLLNNGFSGLVVALSIIGSAFGFVPPEVKTRWKETGYTMEQALVTIDEATKKGKDTDDLFYAVKFIDRFANQLYRPDGKKEELMERINGSWELRLALNSDRDVNFYPHPEFRAFAMAFTTISNNYFGKGIAPDSTFCFVALGGPSSRDIRRRQVFMNYEDYFINGREVPGWDLSYYLRGYARQWANADEKTKPILAFTVIACTDMSLVVRGSKTGGIAIFRRRKEDFAPAAFGYSLD